MLRLVTDADVNGDIIRGARRLRPSLDLLRAHEVELRTANDELLLEWAATEERIVITNDKRTMVGSAYARVSAGLPMPGVFVFRPEVTVGDAIDAILLLDYCSTTGEWKDQVIFVPL